MIRFIRKLFNKNNEVRMTPEMEKLLNELAAQTGMRSTRIVDRIDRAFDNEQDQFYHEKTMELVRRHDLGFLSNPGGGQFLNASKNIDIQVSFWDTKEDYEQLLAGLRRLNLEPEGQP